LSNVRANPLVLVLGALALLPFASAAEVAGAEATADAFVAEVPEEVELAVPAQTVTVQGQEIGIDSDEHVDIAPGNVVGAVSVDDLMLDVEGPQCKLALDTLKNQDEAQRRCTTGGIRTNAGLDLVEVAVDVTLKDEAAAGDEAGGIETAAATTSLAMPASGTVLLAAAAASASAAGLYGLWRVLKWTGLAAVLPLYSHISDDEILDDPNRAAIYRLIQEEAGISTKTIADRLDLAWGTVTHHLTKLEKRRFVVSKKYGKYRRYFANGTGGTELKDEIAVLRLDRTGDVAQLIRERPGMTQKEVSDVLGVSSSTILWHVKRLEEVHLVRKVRDGKTVRYFPADGLAGVQLIAPA
jgi:DNA-binding transcriptional ArsR family regulator